ncbi:hypothetical protein NFJ02_18g31950 [Pycnococcus provasolii]
MPRSAYEERLPPGDGVGQALKSALDGGAPDPSNMSNEERCVYVLRRGTRNNNHTYMCKSCGKRFTGNRQKIRIHLTGISEGSTFIQKCPRPFTEHFQYCMDLQQKIRGADALKKTLPVSTTKGMEDVLTNVASHGGNSAGDIASKSAQVDNSRGAAAAGCSSGGGQKRKLEQTYLSPRSFEQSRKKEVDVALMELISEAGIPANVVSYNSCEKVFEKAHEYATLTGRAYKPPDRRVFGLDGDALVEGRRRALKEREDVLQKVTEFGNTLCADAMTKYRRPSNNTVLVTRRGVLFGAHVEYSGVSKTDKELADDATRVINELGGIQVVFLCCMDGAAIGVMGILASRFPTMLMQRCATHAFSLIIGDIALFFPETSQFVHELVAFCFAHSKLVHILRCMNGPMLSRPVETRMGSFVLACERILSGRGELEELITARHTVEAVKSSRSKKGSQSPSSRYKQLKARVLNESTWKQLQKAYDVLLPIKIALRITDSGSANLHLSVHAFYSAWASAVKAAGGEQPASVEAAETTSSNSGLPPGG